MLVKTVLNSILAGGLIGIGNIALVSCDNRYIGSLLFAVALLSIIQLQLPLYTGRIGKIYKNKNPGELLMILLCNVIGTLDVCHMYMAMNAQNVDKLAALALTKASKGYLELFIAGILCNILIHIAVTSKKEIITVLCIMGFILCGFEHSIADSGYLFIGLPFISWLIVVAGNSVGGILTEILLHKEG